MRSDQQSLTEALVDIKVAIESLQRTDSPVPKPTAPAAPTPKPKPTAPAAPTPKPKPTPKPVPKPKSSGGRDKPSRKLLAAIDYLQANPHCLELSSRVLATLDTPQASRATWQKAKNYLGGKNKGGGKNKT